MIVHYYLTYVPFDAYTYQLLRDVACNHTKTTFLIDIPYGFEMKMQRTAAYLKAHPVAFRRHHNHSDMEPFTTLIHKVCSLHPNDTL